MDFSALVVFVVFFSLLALRIPVALCLFSAGTAGILMLDGVKGGLLSLQGVTFSTVASYSLLVIPMFVLLGSLIANAGIGEKIFDAAHRLTHRMPGGLAAATVVAMTAFSGVSGSSAADVATFGRLAIGEMKRHGYQASYAGAVVASAALFAVLIPPSIALVLYGILANVSIGAMLLAGLLPGLFSCLVLGIYVIVRAKLRPSSVMVPGYERLPVNVAIRSTGSSAETESADSEQNNRPANMVEDDDQWELPRAPKPRADFSGLLYALILLAVILGGLYSGIFTATEAASVGAFVALIMVVVVVRGRPSRIGGLFKKGLPETLSITGMIFFLLVGGAALNYFIAVGGYARAIADWVVDLGLAPVAVVIVFAIVLIPLGMFVDGLTIMLLTVPIMAPIAAELGLDGIWFGIVILKAIELGLITPPLGINVFIISGVMPELEVAEVFRKIIPFVLLDVAVIAFIIAVPGVVTLLPALAGY